MKRKSRPVKDRPGYLYVLSNPALGQHVYKVGQTGQTPDARARQLSSTAIPSPYSVCLSVRVADRYTAEAYLFQLLADQRISGQREFFILHDLDIVNDTLDYVKDEVQRCFDSGAGLVTCDDFDAEVVC